MPPTAVSFGSASLFPRRRLPDLANICAQLLQLLHHILIALLKMIDRFSIFPWCRVAERPAMTSEAEARKSVAMTGAPQSWSRPMPRTTARGALNSDIGTHPLQLSHMHESIPVSVAVRTGPE